VALLVHLPGLQRYNDGNGTRMPGGFDAEFGKGGWRH
jgi:hypothetical protein